MPPAVMRLQVDSATPLTAQQAERTYLTGFDQIPWPSRTQLANGLLIIDRGTSESGRVHIPICLNGRGELTLSTATLMQREKPYSLEVELARGRLNSVRNQLAEWQVLGLVVPPTVDTVLAEALRHFSQAVVNPEQPVQAAAAARLALEKGMEAGDLLMDAYVEQVLTQRLRQAPKIPAWLGVQIGHRILSPTALDQIYSSFNSLTMSMLWSEIERIEGQYDWSVPDQQVAWCEEHNVRAVSGPLLRLDARGLPDWLLLWEGDFDALLGMMSEHVKRVVTRYRGRVSMWQCAARVNGGKVLSLHEEQMLQLAVRAIEITRQIDPVTPVIVRFDQPWGEYLREGEFELSPLHFADTLVRCGLQMSGVGLELGWGFHPHGTAPRDRLELSRELDIWSCLGLPLHVTISSPSSDQPDPKARNSSLPLPVDHFWTPEQQANWIKQVMPLLLAKPFIQSITWSQLSDAEFHEYSHAGLFDSAGVAKPVFTVLGQYKKRFL
ncbi:MAG: endo-1,4-beta-xylanase [Planctomycetes bacterium]|nr:endo-1,4-beta-xylanase [Planctomycetota bacterium]